MTPELIDLEFMHMEIDRELREKKEGGGKNFVDREFDEWEEDTEAFDSKLSDADEKDWEASEDDEPDFEREEEDFNPEDWEDA